MIRSSASISSAWTTHLMVQTHPHAIWSQQRCSSQRTIRPIKTRANTMRRQTTIRTTIRRSTLTLANSIAWRTSGRSGLASCKCLRRTTGSLAFWRLNSGRTSSARTCYWSPRSPRRSKTQTVDDYESKLKVVGKFETCEQFWTLYSYLKRPHEFETLTEIHIFKDGEFAFLAVSFSCCGCSVSHWPLNGCWKVLKWTWDRTWNLIAWNLIWFARYQAVVGAQQE